MCSTASYVPTLRRTCEVLPASGKLCGAELMSTYLPGVRLHGAPQDAEIDVAWQELMAITDLQFDGSSEGSYETTQCQRPEPAAPVGGYGMAPSHSGSPPAACQHNTPQTYDGCYPEELTLCQNLGSSADVFYGHYGSQLNHRIPIASQTQPLLLAPSEQMNASGTSQMHGAAHACGAQGFSRNMTWTAHAQHLPARSADDPESDSGLSLGSTPPLASPDNPAAGTPGYQNIDMGMTYSDREPGSTRTNIQYATDYQCQSNSYLNLTSLTPQTTSCHTQTLWSVRQQGDDTTGLRDVYPDSGASSRGGSQTNMHAPAPTSRDERRAMTLKIPFPMDRIINLPVDDFNELLTQYSLTDSQLALVRDIRRRGKNKVAAQNCRKRKLESIIHLERELNQLQAQRELLSKERLKFKRSLAFMKQHFRELHSEVFSHLRDEVGRPFAIDEYSLQQTPDGNIYLVPQTILETRE
ncbi:transcription factor NF-E2 45 kDa subunit [Brachionichthys hirsutus]|uniref:transcription factor NF-E2 45 kDa subunit n=1 Tax=Brachionichthys hirsutus TaxID=412623 RepID=UPI0036052B54